MSRVKGYARVKGTGELCPKCHCGMERRERIDLPTKSNSYYTEWDYCAACKHVQHYQEFKRYITEGFTPDGVPSRNISIRLKPTNQGGYTLIVTCPGREERLHVYDDTDDDILTQIGYALNRLK